MNIDENRLESVLKSELEDAKSLTPALDSEVEEVLKEVDSNFRHIVRGMVAQNPTPLREAKRLVKFYRNPGTALVNPTKPFRSDFKVIVPDQGTIRAEVARRVAAKDPDAEKARVKAELARVATLNARTMADAGPAALNIQCRTDAPISDIALYLTALARAGLKPTSTPGLYLVEIPGGTKDIKAWMVTKNVGKGFWSRVGAALKVVGLAIKMVFQRV